jgi:phosphoadenosine phosphosulfate reductase
VLLATGAALTEANILEAKVLILLDAFPTLDLAQRLAAMRHQIRGRIVFTTSFGIEDQAITDAIFGQDLEAEVVTFDTGRLFPETYTLWAETEGRYGRSIRALYPDQQGLEALVARQGVNGFRASIASRERCCTTRKVEPLRRALAGATGWVAGLRAEQSPDRALMPYASLDQQYQVIKVNPVLDWTRERVVAYLHDRSIPCSPLHARGFPSIGCAPCTRAVTPGEDERAGRWWWEREERKECGLHTRAGESRLAPTQSQPDAKGSMP